MNNQDAEMPGSWICDKCNFILQKNVLYFGSGSVLADTSPLNEQCPNDGKLMRPYTWREANEGLFDALIKEQKRINWLDNHCSFVADLEYKIGPFKVGQLREMADAGIKVDEESDRRI